MTQVLGLLPLLSAWIALLAFLPGVGWADAALSKDQLRVTFSPHVFAEVNRNDALASTRAWIEAVGQKRDLELEVEVEAYDSLEELREISANHSVDLYILSAMDYLDLAEDNSCLEPLFLPQSGDFVVEKYNLLVRRERRGSLADLQGKSLLILANAGANLGRLWLDAELEENGLGRLDLFCPTAQDVAKSSSAILPVFFKQADACVVDASSFQLMQELNPQLGRDLEVLLSSPPFLESLICLHREYSGHRAELIKGLAELHEEAAGRQLLMVFKIDQLVPYDEDALDTIRKFRTTQQGVSGMSAR